MIIDGLMTCVTKINLLTNTSSDIIEHSWSQSNLRGRLAMY